MGVLICTREIIEKRIPNRLLLVDEVSNSLQTAAADQI